MVIKKFIIFFVLVVFFIIQLTPVISCSVETTPKESVDSKEHSDEDIEDIREDTFGKINTQNLGEQGNSEIIYESNNKDSDQLNIQKFEEEHETGENDDCEDIEIPNDFVSVTKHPKAKIIDEDTGINKKIGKPGIIPGEYAYPLVFNSKTTYEAKGYSKYRDKKESKDHKSYYRFDEGSDISNKGECYLLVKNVAIYKTGWVDLKIKINSITNERDKDGHIRIYSPTTDGDDKDKIKEKSRDSFLKICIKEKGTVADISYIFLDSETGKKIPFSSICDYKRINKRKLLTFKERDIDGIYMYDNTKIKYNKYKDENEDEIINFIGDCIGKKARTYFTVIFKNREELRLKIKCLKSPCYVNPSNDSIAKVEMPPPTIVGSKIESNSLEVGYEIYQNIPHEEKEEYYPEKLKLTVDIDPIVDINEEDIKIYDLAGTNITKSLDIKVSSDQKSTQVIASTTEKSPIKEYGLYSMKISGKVNKEKNYLKYYKNGYLNVPAHVESMIVKKGEDGEEVINKGNDAKSQVEYKGIPSGKAVPQEVVWGTDLNEMDISKFVTDLRVDTDNDLDKPVVVERLEDVPKTDMPGKYTVTAVIKTKQDVERKIDVPIIAVDGELKLEKVPEEINFKDLELPSVKTIFNRTDECEDIKISDRRYKKTDWNLNVRVAEDLSSNDNLVLKNAFIYSKPDGDIQLDKNYKIVENSKELDLNSDKHIIKWDDDEGIRLVVSPGPALKINTEYTGELHWMLTNAPQ